MADAWELHEPARAAVAEIEDLRELRQADLREAASTGHADLTLGDVREFKLADLEARLFGEAGGRDGEAEETEADGGGASTEPTRPGEP